MDQFNTIAQNFLVYYENLFNTDRAGLSILFKETSTMTFEGGSVYGQELIIKKLLEMPMKKIRREISTLDVQKIGACNDAILISVTGHLLVDEETKPQSYCETFVLVPSQQAYWISNMNFRLTYSLV